MMNMKTSLLVLLLLLLLLSFQTISSSAMTTLESLCSNLGGGYIDYSTCMDSMATDPRSRSARDFPSLATISVDHCVATATGVKSKVMAMLTNDTYTSSRDGLSACLTLYSNVIPALRWSADAIAAGHYANASQAVTAAVSVASTCDSGFNRCSAGGNNSSPLVKENLNFSSVAIVAQAIAEVLSIGS